MHSNLYKYSEKSENKKKPGICVLENIKIQTPY